VRNTTIPIGTIPIGTIPIGNKYLKCLKCLYNSVNLYTM